MAETPFISESINDVDSSLKHYFGRHPAFIWWPIFAIMVYWGSIFFFGGGYSMSFILNVQVLGELYFIPPFMLISIGLTYVRGKIQQEFMEQFAAANNYSYSSVGDVSKLEGSLFAWGRAVGRSQAKVNVVSGLFLGQPFSLFTYSYDTGGRNRVTHYFTVFQFQFNTSMPDLLLESNGWGWGGGSFLGSKGTEHVNLEGDFNKYFTLSIKKGYEVEGLEIVTPDLMNELVEKASMLSLEIMDNNLFIYAYGLTSNKDRLDNLYNMAKFFAEKLAPVLARMQPSLARVTGLADTTGAQEANATVPQANS